MNPADQGPAHAYQPDCPCFRCIRTYLGLDIDSADPWQMESNVIEVDFKERKRKTPVSKNPVQK